jgi:hypothetical protein
MLNESAVENMTIANAGGQYFTMDQLYGYCVDLARSTMDWHDWRLNST